MSDNVEILEVVQRQYDESRDWLVTDDMPPRHNAQVIPFTPKFMQCTICSARTHRASQCPQRPRPARACGND